MGLLLDLLSTGIQSHLRQRGGPLDSRRDFLLRLLALLADIYCLAAQAFSCTVYGIEDS